MKITYQYILAFEMMLGIFVRARAIVAPVQGLKYFSFCVFQVRSLLMVHELATMVIINTNNDLAEQTTTIWTSFVANIWRNYVGHYKNLNFFLLVEWRLRRCVTN